MCTGRDAPWREHSNQEQKGSISANIAGCQPSGCHATDTASMPAQTERYLIKVSQRRPTSAATKRIERGKDMEHLRVVAIEDHVGIAHWREVSGAINQQERNARPAFEQTMDQASCRIALPGMDQDTAVEIGVLILSESYRILSAAWRVRSS